MEREGPDELSEDINDELEPDPDPQAIEPDELSTRVRWTALGEDADVGELMLAITAARRLQDTASFGFPT